MFRGPFTFRARGGSRDDRRLLSLLELRVSLRSRCSRLRLQPFATLRHFFGVCIGKFPKTDTLEGRLVGAESASRIHRLLSTFISGGLRGGG